MMGNKKRCLTFNKLRSSSQSHCDGGIDADFFTLMLLYSWEKVQKKKLACFIVNGRSAEAQTLDDLFENIGVGLWIGSVHTSFV